MRNSSLRAYLKGDERWVFVTVVQEREQKKPGEGGRDFIRELVPDWTPTQTQILWVVRIILGLVMLLIILELVGDYYKKTLWDWLKLLIVPAVLAIGGYWFNAQQRERELAVANQRAQDEALQAYLDQMSKLLLDKDRLLKQSLKSKTDSEESARIWIPSSKQDAESATSEASTLAKARTLTVLTRLDGERKRSVVDFLFEASLICKDCKGLGKWPLKEADLRHARLSEADLERADLRGANLHGANLSKAVLSGARLGSPPREEDGEPTPTPADLSGADVSDADLSDADFSDADLRGARGVTNEELEQRAK
jgi:hypothetical protein